jgi:hypothetical protein
MRLVPRLFTVVVLVLAAPIDAVAQRVITGRVVDPAGVPVTYVNVQIGATRAIADDSGRFVIKVPASPISLRFRRIGFRPGEVDLIAGGDTAIVVYLASLPLELERAVVQGTRTVRALELRGFYRRLADRDKGINSGQFITAEEIEQRNPTRTTQTFEGRTGIRNIRYKPVASTTNDGQDCGGPTGLLCWAPHGVNRCPMAVYLNGIRVPTVDMKDPDSPTLIDETVLPNHVAGIEIYTTAGRVPPEIPEIERPLRRGPGLVEMTHQGPLRC